jgi:hypothetical protein
VSAPSPRPYREGDREGLAKLFAGCPYNDLRRYRIVSKEKQAAWLLHIFDACARGGKAWVLNSGDDVSAAAAVRPLEWDTSIFGIKMGQIPVLAHRGRETPAADLARLLDAVLDGCRRDGLKHLNIRVDADDIALVQALESRGFYLADTIVTYIFIPRRQELGHFKYLFTTRTYRGEDRDEVLAVGREAYKNFFGRYHADPHLPKAQCNLLYALWTQKLLDGGIAERIIVSERRGKIVGFLGYVLNRAIFESTGVKCVGGGLGGCTPEGFVAYAAILEEAMREGMHRYDMQDFETQLNNVNIIRIYQKLNFEYARAKYTFHAWLK